MAVPEHNASPPVEPDQLLLQRYRLLQRVARGPMAEVWEGRDEVLSRPVAIKLLHRELAADGPLRERFRRQAVAAARLAHPNVVATFDTGEAEGIPFIVMELVRGRTLREVLADHGSLTPAAAVAVTVQIADALRAAHLAGLVHGDLKPANISLSESDGGREVKVGDFGIAQAASRSGAEPTDPGTARGGARYLSPEQLRGAPADPRSDIYALGVVLFEMVAGRSPYPGDDERDSVTPGARPEPLRLRQLRAGVPRPLEAIVARAMAREPASRYQTADDLRAALLGLDLVPDDATTTVERDATPPGGVVVASFGRTERPWLVPAALIVLVSVLLVTAGVLFSRSEVGQELLGRPEAAPPDRPVQVVSVTSFDPEGPDGEENESRAALAGDGDPATRWSTDRYNSRNFGGLPKSGVGLVLELSEATTLTRMTVASPTRGWSARVYVAEQPGDRLADWGSPVATLEGVAGHAEFHLAEARGKVVLLWLTGLGDDNRVEVAEVTVEGRRR